MKGTEYCPETEDRKTYNVNFGKVMFLDQNLLDENVFPEQHWDIQKLGLIN